MKATQEQCDAFDIVADLVEKKMHGEVKVDCDKDYKDDYHIALREIGDEDDEDGEILDHEGYFTFVRRVFSDLDEATKWLKESYL